ncbi:MAG: hypothetical protein Kow0077_23780 [Anaerolineae bacterium]
MSPSIQQRLQDSDPNVRRKAIIALGKSGDKRALPLLAKAYRTDPDPALRNLALKAGRHLRQQLEQAQNPTAGIDPRYRDYARAGFDDGEPDRLSYIRPVYDDDELPPVGEYAIVDRKPTEDVAVSDADRRRAADLARSALEAQERGDNEEALHDLIAAIELNPALKDNATAQKIASRLTGQRGDEAIQILADPMRRKMYIGQVEEKQITRAKKTGGVGWGDVGFDLAILFIVFLLGTFVSLWGMRAMFDGLVASGEMPPDMQEVLALLSVPSILVMGVIGGIYTIITALITYSIIHVVSGFFGGTATLTQTLHALIPIQTVLYVAGGVLMGVAVVTQSIELVGLLAFVLSFGGLAWQVRALAKVQDFGWLSGCAALIVGSIVLGVLSWMLAIIVSGMLGGLLTVMEPMFTGLWLPAGTPLLPF